MERLTERDAYWIGEEFWTSAREPDDEEIDAVYEKLKSYEDKQEQGLLIELPCKVGDIIYSHTGGRIVDLEVLEVIYHCEAESHGVFIRERIIVDCEGVTTRLDFSEIGKTVFLTRSEAEEALAKMGE